MIPKSGYRLSPPTPSRLRLPRTKGRTALDGAAVSRFRSAGHGAVMASGSRLGRVCKFGGKKPYGTMEKSGVVCKCKSLESKKTLTIKGRWSKCHRLGR